MSGAHSLKEMLLDLGCEDQVLHFYDDLSIGPIADICGVARKTWAIDYFGDEFEPYWILQLEFWEKIRAAANNQYLVWMSRRSSLEIASFCEFISCLPPDTSFSLAEFSQEQFWSLERGYLFSNPIGIGILNGSLLKRGFEILKTHVASDFEEDIKNWAKLKIENAPLRAFRDLKLISMDAEHFDHYMLADMTSDWQSAAHIIGGALIQSAKVNQTSEIGDLWLLSRLYDLAEEGQVEFKDEDQGIKSMVRLNSL